MHAELAAVRTDFLVRRWDADQVAWAAGKLDIPGEPQARHLDDLGVRPYSATLDEDCNLITLAGWAAILGSLAGTSITNKISATDGRIGVGTSSSATSPSDTHLGGDTGGGSTTSYYQLVSGAPVISTASSPATLVLAASFGSSVANFAWNEFGCDNYTASGVTSQSLSNVVFLNHGISAQGTKASGQVWSATATLSFGFPSGSGTLS